MGHYRNLCTLFLVIYDIVIILSGNQPLFFCRCFVVAFAFLSVIPAGNLLLHLLLPLHLPLLLLLLFWLSFRAQRGTCFSRAKRAPVLAFCLCLCFCFCFCFEGAGLQSRRKHPKAVGL
jgi:hypothetical protein